MIAASVDDLPDPVGPVTSTMPFLSDAMSVERRRQAELRERRDLVGDHPHHDRVRAALPEDVDAEPRAVGQRVREVARALFS